MPAEKLSMRKIKEVLRLKFELGFANRQIARSCKVSHSTVAEYLHRAEAAGLKSWPLPVDLDETELESRLFPPSELKTPRAPFPIGLRSMKTCTVINMSRCSWSGRNISRRAMRLPIQPVLRALSAMDRETGSGIAARAPCRGKTVCR